MTNIFDVLPLALVLAIPAVAAAAPPAPDIVVVASQDAELQRWVARVERGISQKMRFPRTLGPEKYAQGVVDVTFMCSEDGTPSKVAVVGSSGSRQLDRAGLRAIGRVDTLHPLPSGISHGQVYKAHLLFARTAAQAKRAIALRDEGQTSNSHVLARRQTTASLALMPAGTP
jgi:periplasmic protein TonB